MARLSAKWVLALAASTQQGHADADVKETDWSVETMVAELSNLAKDDACKGNDSWSKRLIDNKVLAKQIIEAGKSTFSVKELQMRMTRYYQFFAGASELMEIMHAGAGAIPQSQECKSALGAWMRTTSERLFLLPNYNFWHGDSEVARTLIENKFLKSDEDCQIFEKVEGVEGGVAPFLTLLRQFESFSPQQWVMESQDSHLKDPRLVPLLTLQTAHAEADEFKEFRTASQVAEVHGHHIKHAFGCMDGVLWRMEDKMSDYAKQVKIQPTPKMSAEMKEAVDKAELKRLSKKIVGSTDSGEGLEPDDDAPTHEEL